MRDFCVNDIVRFFTGGVQYHGSVTKVTSKHITVTDLEEYETYVVKKEAATLLMPICPDRETWEKFAKYQISLQDILGDNIMENLVNKNVFSIAPEDVFCALKKFLDAHISLDTLYEEWLCYWGDILLETTYKDVDNDFFNDNVIMQKTIGVLMNGACYGCEVDCESVVKTLAQYIEDKEKPLSCRRYPDYAKQALLDQMDRDDALNRADAETAALYKRFAEELCEKNDSRGLLAVGYGSYGGNRVFPCDWHRAEVCMLKLIETVPCMPNQAFYANTLGYIYYYGRTTNGVPDYEKAYRYFSFAAFNQIYEAQYKIADMYQNGYGVPKSKDTARNIIERLYRENLEYMENGQFDCKFADIAFRMGNICKDDTDLYESDFDSMLEYYYQAAFAIRMRMQEVDYYGDSAVAGAIAAALSEAKEAIGFTPSKKVEWYSVHSLFAQYLERGNSIDVKVKRLTGGRCKLTFRPHKSPKNRYPKRFFITIPDLDMCGMYDSLTVIARSWDGTEIVFPEEAFTVDQMHYDAFLLDGRKVFQCDNCLFEIKKPNSNGKTYRFASVVFHAGNPHYDYLCDDLRVQIGDQVKVKAGNEEKTVTVVGISEKTESEMALPLKAYKRVL